MNEQAEHVQCTGDWPQWFWDQPGCVAVVTEMFLDDDCVPETEDVEQVEEEG